MKHRVLLLALALCLLFQLTACGRDPAAESPSPSVPPSSAPTAEATPTPEPPPTPTPVPTPEPTPALTFPALLASHQLTGVLLWQDSADTFRLEKGELSGPAPIALPDSYVNIALVDAEPEDWDVSVHILTAGETIVYDLLWSEEEETWQEALLTIPAPTLNIAAEPPLDEDALAIDVPDFLTEEQQLLYRKAYFLYTHTFGGNTDLIDIFDADPDSYVFSSANYGFYSYQIASGRYQNWADFDQVVHSVFTDDYWQQTNCFPGADGITYPTYMEYDGKMAFISSARGGGWYNDDISDQFKLVSKTDTTIEFTVTGHYADPYDRTDFQLTFPLRMVLTEVGWRFEQYHCVQTDYVLELDDVLHSD